LNSLKRIVRSRVRRLFHEGSGRVERLKYRKFFPKPDGNTNLDWHIRQAAGWLVRAQDFGDDRGVAYGAHLHTGFLPSYPETTGYIIPTFLTLAQYLSDPNYRQRAIAMGDWEIEVQMPCGAAMAGRVGQGRPSPAIFNTGQVLLGWTALFRSTQQVRFREAGRRAAEWMIENQEPDGNWVRGNSPLANQGSTVYNVKAAWGLAEFGVHTGSLRCASQALKNAEYALRLQHSNGWFENCCLSDPKQPLLHTIAYTMQGLLGIGRLLGRPDLIEAVTRTADSLIELMDEEGFIPGQIDSSLRGCVDWCCLTGSAQTAIVWGELYDLTRDRKYLASMEQVNRYLMLRHDTSSDNPAVRGGLSGSWPVWGEYGQYLVLNWATKFLVDALILQKRLATPAYEDQPNSIPAAV
jgi:hypothetical protein